MSEVKNPCLDCMCKNDENCSCYKLRLYETYQQSRMDTLQECWKKYNKMSYGFFEEWLAEQLKEQK